MGSKQYKDHQVFVGRIIKWLSFHNVCDLSEINKGKGNVKNWVERLKKHCYDDSHHPGRGPGSEILVNT